MQSYRIQELPQDAPDPDAGLTIEQMKAHDSFDEGVVERVDKHKDGGCSITTEDGMGFGLSAERLSAWRERTGKEPEKGMSVRIYPGHLGNFHGVDLDGVEVFWQTPLERDAERCRWLADHDRKQRERFAEERDRLDADFNALPGPLKARIQRFREADPGFRVTDEPYELFCCVEAAKVADHLRPRIEAGEDAEAVVEEFRESWGEQKGVISDGHSGNTFGGATHLAYRLLVGEPC